MPSKAVLLTPILLSIGVYYWWSMGMGQERTPDKLNPQYDFIVVGGGSAGSVLAARLSADLRTTVLLIEAGSHEYTLPFSHIPGAAPLMQMFGGVEFFGITDWAYKTVRQTASSLGIDNQESHLPRGKSLGGTSLLNYMIANRGHPGDYDRWASEEHDNCPNWSFKDILPFFKASEHAHFDHDSSVHGDDGPISLTKVQRLPLTDSVLAAAQELGVSVHDDYHEIDKHEGYSLTQQTVTPSGYRASTARQYLRPAMGRDNLHVLTNAHVTKINFDEHRSVVGVSYMHGGKSHRVLINNELVLTAGAVNTPQLLMLSGVGDKGELEKLKIPVVLHNPAVGRNLIDHLILPLFFAHNDTTAVDGADRITFDPIVMAKHAIKWIVRGEGHLGNTPVLSMGFMSSGLLPKNYHSDIQTYLFPADPFADGLFDKLSGLDKEIQKRGKSGAPSSHSIFTMAVALMHPQSRGTIKLQSNDAMKPPIIDPNYLSEDVDVKILIKAIHHVRDLLLKTSSSRRFDIQFAESPMSECRDKGDSWSEEYLECLIRHRAITLYHPTSTARMGQSIEDNSVVDTMLRVHSLSRLRICDASIFPSSLSANTNLPVIAVAERCAKMLLDHKNRS